MSLNLHPEAAKNFDAKAEELLKKLIPDPNISRRRAGGAFLPNIVIPELSEDAVKDVLDTGYANRYGREVAKTFMHGSAHLGLFEDGYKDLVRLAEKMQKTTALRDTISVRFLTDTIFKWVARRYKQQPVSPMTQHVLPLCEKEIREVEIWIPVAMLHIQSDIQIGKVTLKTITKQMIDVWHGGTVEQVRNSGATVEPELQQHLQDERRELQGHAAATLKLTAEPHRASERAFAEAERAVAMLRVFSPANLDPQLVSFCTLMGKEHLEETKELPVQDGKIMGYSRGVVYEGSPFWSLNNQAIRQLEEAGLALLSDLLAKDDLTEYQEALLDSLQLYSKCALAKDPSDKLIAILVALETMLLKDGSESIQQNLAERMAFLIKAAANERRAIKNKVLKAYGLRSSFIHHGHRIGTDEMDALKEFMMAAWVSFFALMRASNHWTTKAEMFDQLEEWKMS